MHRRSCCECNCPSMLETCPSSHPRVGPAGGRLEMVDGALHIVYPKDISGTGAAKVAEREHASLSPDMEYLDLATTLEPLGIKTAGDCIGNGEPLFRVSAR